MTESKKEATYRSTVTLTEKEHDALKEVLAKERESINGFLRNCCLAKISRAKREIAK
jgi:hypothetical protein